MRVFLSSKISAILLIAVCLSSTPVAAQDVAKLQWGITTRGGANDFNRAAVLNAGRDATGNIYIGGTFNYTADMDPGPGVYNITAEKDGDAFILKLDASGNFLWAGTFGNLATKDINAMTVDDAGNTYFTGYFNGTMDVDPTAGVTNIASTLSSNIFVLKIDPNGQLAWFRQVGTGGLEVGYGIDCDAAGNVYIVGYQAGSTDFDPGPGSTILAPAGGFVWKLTGAGDFGWVKNFSGVNRIAVDPTGNVLLAGLFSSSLTVDNGTGGVTYTSAGGTDLIVAKLNSSGTYAWSGQMGGTSNDEVWAIDTDASGNMYTAGFFAVSGDFDPKAGVTTLTGNAGTRSTYFVKINGADGSLGYAKSLTGTGDVWPFSIMSDGTDLYVGGRYAQTADFDPGATTYAQTALGTVDTFVLRTDLSNGDFKWVASMGTTGVGSESASSALIPVGVGEVITVGAHRNRMDADPGPCTSYVDAADGGYDVFAIKLGTGPPLPVPTLVSFSPTSGPIGTAVNLVGTNFGPTPADNAVLFNTTTAVVTANTSTSIDTSVPAGATSGKIKVTAYCTTLTSVADFTITGNPTITSFTPTSGPVGATVTVNGTNFSTTPANNVVKFNGTTAVVTTSTTTKITTSVPVGATTGRITVVVGSSATATSATNFTVTASPAPTITGFTPASGPQGATVTINGTNFSATPSVNDVKFNGVSATVSSSTATTINTVVPVGATTGKITVTIGANTATSANDFTVTASTATITINTQPVGASACDGGSTSFTVSASGTTNLGYQWQFAPSANPSNFADLVDGGEISGATTTTLNLSVTATSAGVYRCRVSGDNASPVTTNGVTLLVTGSCNTTPPVFEPKNLKTVVGGLVTLDLVPLITTTNNNLDINSISIVTPPPSGATTSISDGVLTIDYSAVTFVGTEEVEVSACDLDGSCSTQTFSIEVAGDLVVFNALSPGGANPSFQIENIELFEETRANKVLIFDRWQNLVWNGDDYDNTTVVFSGVSNSGKDLPTGTYFYRIEFPSGRKEMTGFISLKR